MSLTETVYTGVTRLHVGLYVMVLETETEKKEILVKIEILQK